MAVLEALAIVLALVALAMLPCLLVFLVFVDAFMHTVHRQRARIRREADVAAQAVDVPAEPEAIGPPLERIAAEIHRLTRARRICESGTARFIAATKAYDRRLAYACRALDIDEHMAGLSGVDLDLERLRVEGLLLEAGFVLDTDSTRPL